MSRRNVLLGLGTLIAGGGAVLGTGAFTTVEAQRTVNVQTTGDASAFLGLSAARDDGDYVSETGSGTIQINLDGSGSSADGINKNARSRFENLVEVANNGEEEVGELNFEFIVDGLDSDAAETDHEEAMKITAGDATLDADGTENFLDSNYADADLTSGASVTFGIEIDLLDSDISDIDTDANIALLITAESASS